MQGEIARQIRVLQQVLKTQVACEVVVLKGVVSAHVEVVNSQV